MSGQLGPRRIFFRDERVLRRAAAVVGSGRLVESCVTCFDVFRGGSKCGAINVFSDSFGSFWEFGRRDFDSDAEM